MHGRTPAWLLHVRRARGFQEAWDARGAGPAGSARVGARRFIERELARSPVISVLGNYVHYGPMAHGELEEVWALVADATPGLHFLNGAAVTIDGVRLYGCTWYSGLWDDAESGVRTGDRGDASRIGPSRRDRHPLAADTACAAPDVCARYRDRSAAKTLLHQHEQALVEEMRARWWVCTALSVRAVAWLSVRSSA